MAQRVRKAVIPAGGLGTRFLPVTKSVPKELLPIGTKPTLQIVIEEAVASGIEEVLLVLSPQKEYLLDFFSRDTGYVRELNARGKGTMLTGLHSLLEQVKIRTVKQPEPKGLGHAVLCTQDVVGNEPFLIILPDVLIVSKTPCCRQLIDAYNKVGCSVSATEHTPKSMLHLYGIYDVERTEGKVHWARGVVEKPATKDAPSDFSVVGRYLFDPEVFPVLEQLKPGRNEEIQLADAMHELAKKGRMAAVEYEGRQFDTGDPMGFLKANIYYSWQSAPKELNEFLKEMASGGS